MRMRLLAVFWIQEEKDEESGDKNRSGDYSKHYFSPFGINVTYHPSVVKGKVENTLRSF